MATENKRRNITLLILLALMMRLGWAVMQPSSDAAIDRLPDQREYLSLGRNLLHEGSLFFIDARFEQKVYAYRTPGYPIFIAMLGGQPLAIRIGQAILDSSTVLAIYLLARHLLATEGAALLAAFIVAVNPFLIYFSGLILSETLFTALLTWGTLCLVRRRVLAGSVLFLFAVLVRPSAIAVAPLVAGAAAVNWMPGSSYLLLPALRRGAIAAATVSGVIFIGLAPWAARNHGLLGNWIWTTSNSGVTLYDGFNPQADGSSNQRFLAEMPQLRSINEVERSRYLQGLARDWIAKNPGEIPGLALKKIARTWSPAPLSAEYGRSFYQWISALYVVPFDVLVLVGLFSRFLSRSVKVLLIVPAIYFTVVHAMSVGSLRYRVPVEPGLAVVATIGALTLISGGAKRRGVPAARRCDP